MAQFIFPCRCRDNSAFIAHCRSCWSLMHVLVGIHLCGRSVEFLVVMAAFCVLFVDYWFDAPVSCGNHCSEKNGEEKSRWQTATTAPRNVIPGSRYYVTLVPGYQYLVPIPTVTSSFGIPVVPLLGFWLAFACDISWASLTPRYICRVHKKGTCALCCTEL